MFSSISITRTQMKIVTEAFDNAGLSHYIVKTSNSLDLKRTVDIGAEVWENGAVKRGKEIDEILNGHRLGNLGGLGENFPVVDRLEGKTLVSTKSLDIASPNYQKTDVLTNALNKYTDSLKNFEKKYMKKFGDRIEWGGTVLYKTQYDEKALEIVLPNSIITEDTLNVLKTFKENAEKDGIHIWYVVTK